MAEGEIHIGTSGWSYKHWKGIFYPEKMPSSHYLEFYLTQFGCVELNASFYRLPNQKTIESWSKLLPADFKMAVKLSRQITHYRRLKNVKDELKTFMDLFKPLYSRLGPILVQLPPSMKYDPVSAESFYKLLKKKYRNFSFSLEARNQSWFTDEAIKLAADYNIGWIIGESGGRFPQKEAITSDQVYLRFHGPENPTASGYSKKELSDWAKKISRWDSEGLKVWIFFNNDTSGHAILNARTMTELLKNKLQEA